MRGRTVLVATAAVGVCYALWRLPATQRFVRTVREAAAEREGQLREAVDLAVRTDATTRAPRHAAGARVPDLDVPARALGADDEGRSLTPDEARALLLDPAGRPHAAEGRAR